MKSPYRIVVLLLAALGQFPHYNHAQIYPSIEEEVLFQINTVISSSFELALYPTPTKLEDGAIENVQKMIKNALLMASSSSSDFVSLETIEILDEGMEYKQNYKLNENSASTVQGSLLQFKVMAYFDLQGTTSSRPSRFAMDNLIVRTFSQPSTKSRFVELITLTGDPFLIEVEDIGINLVKSNERVVDGEAAKLSKIDIILISASSFILIGIFLVLMAHCQKEGYEDIQEQKAFKAKNRPVKTVDDTNRVDETDSNGPNDVEKDQISLARMMSVEGNIVEAGSLESSVDSQSLMVISVQNKSPAVSFASSSSSNFTSGSKSSASSSSASSSSASSSSASKSSASKSSASTCTSSREDYADASLETSRGEQGDSTIDSESMGSKNHNYESTIALTKATSALASKLLSLPRTDTNVLRKKFGSAYSLSVSAPTILEETETTRQSTTNESKIDDKSIKSARSAASSESFELNENRNLSDPTLSRSVPKNQVLLNGLVMLESTREFHKSWLESKRKALEDIEEEGAVDDVFHIDVQRSGIFLEEAETMKSTSTWRPVSVSEWMKSIRVINSASDTQSSVEHSSTGDPKSSHHARENNSLDLSLEDSLATSMVEP
uniref:SEA domain-containing protein n=1 Tax=Pseudo-nitzschia australis TaxID=44445 RepID=A0A7S4AJJ6_9STRA|mmetsp:Transcript_27510/g.59212  ORF Transcript_27510/g.59212 Transcript_27510/m.59212 type:complete len:611 (-) Transcript_27510:82-1914(-)